MVDYDDIRAVALDLPGAFEQESYGAQPSWRTKPRMFAWIRDEPEALVVWVDSVEEREALIETEPKKFFTTAHYDGHPIVLVQLAAIDKEQARELMTDSWRLRAPKSLVKQFDEGG